MVVVGFDCGGEGWFYLWVRREGDKEEERETTTGEERDDEEDKESEMNKKFNSIGFNVRNKKVNCKIVL